MMLSVILKVYACLTPMVVQALLPRDWARVRFRRRPGCQADRSDLEAADFPTNNQLLVRKPSLGWLLRVDSAFAFPPSLVATWCLGWCRVYFLLQENGSSTAAVEKPVEKIRVNALK